MATALKAKTEAQAVEAQTSAPAKTKAAPKAKPATKAAKPTATKPAGKAKPASAKTKVARRAAAYGLATHIRPGSGKALQAHTEAVLQFFGLHGKNGQVMKADLVKVMGATAVAYHANPLQGNFVEVEPGALALSERGRLVFADRASKMADDAKALVATYLAILTTGKPDGKVVKDAMFINKFAA